jgi:hypothetical protein
MDDKLTKEGCFMQGKGKATGALVCGIISCVLGAGFGWTIYLGPIAAIVLGIISLVLSGAAKKEGFVGGMATAGFVLGLLGLIFGGISFVSCTLCTGCTVCTALLSA